MHLNSKPTKFKQLQSQLHKLLLELITHMSCVITHVGDTYCAHGVYFEIMDEFLTGAISCTTVCFTHITILGLAQKFV